MKSENNNQKPTELQFLISKLSREKISKVDETYFGLCADTKIDQKPNDQVQFQNQYLMDRFSIAVLGKSPSLQSGKYQKLSIESANLWVKEVTINGKSIRLVFLPLTKYQLDEKNGPESYKQMVMNFFLFNKLLKPESTKKKTLISISYMQKPQVKMGGRLQVLKLFSHTSSTLSDLTKWFNLGSQQIKSKVVFVIDIAQKRQSITFSDKLTKQNKIYVLTNDEAEHPLYGLEESGEAIRLRQESTDLLNKVNHVCYIESDQCPLYFNYNRFLSYRPKLTKDNFLDKNISNELWAVITAMVQPIYKVKQQIYKKYKLETQAKQPPQGNLMPQEYPKDENWQNKFGLTKDLKTFNQFFGYEQWKEQNNEPRTDIQDQFGITNQTIKKPQEKLLKQYTDQFDLNIKFIKQQENFNHAMIMDQINRISKDLETKSEIFQKQSDLKNRYLLQRKLLQFAKIIARFLNSLKNHKLFSKLLENYQSKFYEHLISVYAEAYDQFCWANKIIFGKLFDLSQKIKDLQSSKKQILKVVKSVNDLTQNSKQNHQSIDQLRTKRQLLQILLNLLEQNKSTDKDKEVDIKILSTKYDLASTYEKLAVLEDFGNVDSKELKNALKIIFFDLYKHLFYDNKNFETEYADRLGFMELDLLKRISGILKALGRLDLSIQIEKKQGNHSVIENYYNRWLMKYRGDMNKQDADETKKILIQAIQYFKTKFLPEKVKLYYGLLIKNSRSLQEQKKYDMERLDYETDMNDPAQRIKFIQKAKNSAYPLTKTTVEQIMKVYQVKSTNS